MGFLVAALIAIIIDAIYLFAILPRGLARRVALTAAQTAFSAAGRLGVEK
jgi:hypothetical protein